MWFNLKNLKSPSVMVWGGATWQRHKNVLFLFWNMICCHPDNVKHNVQQQRPQNAKVMASTASWRNTEVHKGVICSRHLFGFISPHAHMLNNSSISITQCWRVFVCIMQQQFLWNRQKDGVYFTARQKPALRLVITFVTFKIIYQRNDLESKHTSATARLAYFFPSACLSFLIHHYEYYNQVDVYLASRLGDFQTDLISQQSLGLSSLVMCSRISLFFIFIHVCVMMLEGFSPVCKINKRYFSMMF